MLFETVGAVLQYLVFRNAKRSAGNEKQSIAKVAPPEHTLKLDACAQAFRANPDSRDLPHSRYRIKALAGAGALTHAKHDERPRNPTKRAVPDGPDTNARLYSGRDRTGRNGRFAELRRVGQRRITVVYRRWLLGLSAE